MARPASRARKTKAEVQTEFEKIQEDSEAAKSDWDLKGEETARLREAEVKETVADLSVDTIVQKIGGLGVEISKHLSDVSSRLTVGTHLLSSLREAVTIEKKELERLHKIDIAKTSLDLLLEEYRLKSEELEKEMVQKRSDWESEKASLELERKEFEEGLKRLRVREKEEYEYQKNLERKKEENEYSEGQRLLERKNRERQELLEKSWAEREKSLKVQEEELLSLRKEKEQFSVLLKAEVEKAVGLAIETEKGSSKQQILLLQKEFEAEKRVAELKIKGLEEVVARQYAQVESLTQKLDDAKQQVQDIAIKAIEGASGARALSHVNQIAMEQAKTRGSNPI